MWSTSDYVIISKLSFLFVRNDFFISDSLLTQTSLPSCTIKPLPIILIDLSTVTQVRVSGLSAIFRSLEIKGIFLKCVIYCI